MELVSEALTCASVLRSALSQNHSVCDVKEALTNLRVIRYIIKLTTLKEKWHRVTATLCSCKGPPKELMLENRRELRKTVVRFYLVLRFSICAKNKPFQKSMLNEHRPI